MVYMVVYVVEGEFLLLAVYLKRRISNMLLMFSSLLSFTFYTSPLRMSNLDSNVESRLKPFAVAVAVVAISIIMFQR